MALIDGMYQISVNNMKGKSEGKMQHQKKLK